VTGPIAQQDEAVEQGLPAVENLTGVLVKALRATQLYLPNNPIYQKAVEALREAFGAVWEHVSELRLVVTESDLVWEGKPVLSQPTKSESVAWVLFKDGVRAATFSPGAEDEEIVRFLRVVHRCRNLDAQSPDDLLTLLWDQDFQSIRYEYVELGTDDVPPIERSEKPPLPPPPPGEAQREVETAEEEEERPSGIVSLEEFDSTLYFLDETEKTYLRNEIEREYSQDLRRSVLAMLFDLLELQTFSTVRAELLTIVENFIPYLLAVGDFQSVAYILREIRVVLQRAREVLPEHRTQLEQLPDRLSEPQSLGQLLQSLDEALVHPTEEELGDLFRELRPGALETVLAWLPKLTNERVRGLLDHAGQRLAQAYPEHFVRALGGKDEAVLLQAIRIAGQLKIPPVIPPLGQLLVSGGVLIRRGAVEALTAIGTPGALRELERALVDDDREVRVGSVRAIAAAGYRNGLPAVQDAVGGRRLREADLTEKTAFFEAYGTLAGPKGLAVLMPLLEAKGGLMKKKEDPEIRACAAMALGRIGGDEVRGPLERAAADKDPLVRNAANKALRELR
jgi:hypothetical protein